MSAAGGRRGWIDPERVHEANVAAVRAGCVPAPKPGTFASLRRAVSRISRAIAALRVDPADDGRAALLKDAVRATWRGTTAVNPATGREIGISFDTPNGVVRLELDVDGARQLSESVRDMLQAHQERTNSHSFKKRGSPSVDVSTPEE